MTFCLGIRVDDGLVAFADTHITRGSERGLKNKIVDYRDGDDFLFLMTSGLRSIRDKVVTYFEDAVRGGFTFERLYEGVNLFGEQVKRVALEDAQALQRGGLRFDLHAIIGGRVGPDEHSLYYVYPEGNWIDISGGAPYFIIGRTGYGRPILERALDASCSLEQAIALGYLAFDATRTSATSVDLPVDVVVHDAREGGLRRHRFQNADLAPAADWWQEHVRRGVREFPTEWAAPVLRRRAEPTSV